MKNYGTYRKLPVMQKLGSILNLLFLFDPIKNLRGTVLNNAFYPHSSVKRIMSFVVITSMFFLNVGYSQIVTAEVDWDGSGGPGCFICGDNYSCYTAGELTFSDPVVPGNIITLVKVKILYTGCSAGTNTITINNELIGTHALQGDCLCGDCYIDSVMSVSNPELLNYNYGGINSLRLEATTTVCVDRAIIEFYTQSAGPNDAGVISIDTFNQFCPGTYPVYATIQNFGTNIIDSVEVDWEFDGIAQVPVSYDMPLDTFGGMGSNIATVFLGNKTFAANSLDEVKAWTENPNGVPDTVNLNDTLLVNLTPGLVGTYTIGGASPDFSTFTEAVNTLTQSGVCGPVVFNVRNGTYNEQIVLPEILGMDATNTVTFQSESGDSSQVVLTFSASNGINYTLLLDGADWFTFKNLTIEGTNTSYGRALEFRNGASHNQFSNCELRGISTNSTSTNLTVVHSPDNGVLDEYNEFKNNRLLNGSYGFYWFGDNSSVLEKGNVFEGNLIENVSTMGIYVYYQDAVNILGNEILTSSIYNGSRGIYAVYCDNGSKLSRNKITGFHYGLWFEFCDGTVSDKIEVLNNFVQIIGTIERRGIYSYEGVNQLIAYNSVQVENSSSQSSAFYTYRGSNKMILNNIFANLGGGYAFYRSSTNGISQSNYNDLYTSGQHLGYWDGLRETLTDWQNASLLDLSSFDVDPLFLTSGDFSIAQISFNGAAMPIAGVSIDIDGDLRDAQMPDIGADEFDPIALDAGVILVVHPTVPFAAGTQSIAAVIKNFGTSPLTSLTVNWEHNDTLKTAVNWTGNLASGDTAVVNLGTLDLAIIQSHEIISWSSDPNGMADPLAINDTSSVENLYAALSGTYTLGGSSPDFMDFAEATNTLQNGGVVGAVTFDVRNGTYNEQVALNEVPGASMMDDVTFQSESGDSSLVKLTFDAGFSNNYIFLLNGADWVRLKKMTLEALDNSYGRVLDLRNGANNNTFENCAFRGRPTSSTSSNLATIYSQGTNYLDEFNVFQNNYIVNGSFGIHLNGINSNNREQGIIIQNNHIDSSYYRGVYLYYMEGPVVQKNLVTTASTTNSSTGLYLEFCYNNVRVVNNKILGFRDRGIFISELYGTLSDQILVANNFVEVLGTNTAYGIYSSGGSFQQIYHNTVSVTSTASNTYAFRNNWGNDKEILNNIFSNTGGGYAIYTNNTFSIVNSDYNDLYATGTNLGYWNGDRTDLPAWIAASNQDSNSLSVDPFFISAIDLHITNTALDKQGQPVSEVGYDIDGDARDPSIPDIGADEIITDALDAGIFAIVSPSMPFPEGTQAVEIRIVNNGSMTLTSADVDWEVNGAGQSTYNWAGSIAPGQKSDPINLGSFNFQIGNTYSIKSWTSNPNGGTDEEPANDTSSVENLFTALSGIYTIGGISPDFLNFTEAANAMEMGGVAGSVVFNVRNGTYNEQLSFPEFNGVNADNTVTFQSESADSSQVILTFSSPSSNNYTVRLDGGDWFIFKDITLEATNTTYSRVVVLQNSANHNLFENCELRGISTNSSWDARAVVFSPDNNVLDEYNSFKNCLVRNGSHGFFILGNNANDREEGNVIENCIVENPYYDAVYTEDQTGIKIYGNQFLTNSNASNGRGLESYYLYNNSIIAKNIIKGFSYGLLMYYTNGTPAEHAKITNNFVLSEGTNSQHGIFIFGGVYQDLFHNTVRQIGSNSTSSAFHSSSGSNNVTYNNIFSNEGGGYAVYRSSNNDIVQSDHNAYYTTGSSLAYYLGNNIETLADWQNTTFHDVNSFELNPFFLSNDSFKVAQVSFNKNGTPLVGITEDIENEPRDAQNPDIGCDEFIPPPVDVGVAYVFLPTVPFMAGDQPVSVSLKNYGDDDLTSATINWTVNNVVQAAINWTGFIASGDTAVVGLGDFNFPVNQAHDIVAWSTLPNGQADMVALNDTAQVENVFAGLSGTYTIGGTTPTFNTFAEAVVNLDGGGVLGPVVFNVRDGSYNEQVVLQEVIGANINNTITFQSESGDSSAVTLTFSANSNANYTLLLDGADWIRFMKMGLAGTQTTYGTVIDYRNGATQNRFENCRITGVVTTSTGTSRSVIYSPDNNMEDDDNVFANNLILNGSYGFYLFGNSTNNLETGLVIENNRIENSYYQGIFARYMEQAQIVSNQFITSSSYTFSQGLYLDDFFDDVNISNNQIVGFTGAGIYLIDSYADVNSPILVTNNFIYTDGPSSGYGIYTDDGSHQKFYHNTIHVTNPVNSGSYGFYTFRGNNKDVRNNIFANSGDGYALYRSSTNGVTISDYNDLYTTGTNIAYWNGNRATLADWQSASGFDANSISENPFFLTADSFGVAQISLNMAATPVSQVTTDIQGEARDSQNPDIGCDEFMPVGIDAGISMVQPPVVPFAAGQQLVQAVLKNFGADTLQSATINWTVNGAAQTPVAWTGGILSGDTMLVELDSVNFSINQSYDIVAWSSQPNGSNDPVMLNDTSSIADLYAGLGGIYTIGGTSPDFNSFSEAAFNLNQGGVVDTVTFNVRNGTYDEQLYLTEILGVDSSQTVTFQSESGDSSSVVLTHNSNSDANYTCILDGADWIRLKRMTLAAQNTVWGTVLDYRNGANNNRFEHCEFQGININSTGTTRAVIFSSNSPNDGVNVFLNNYISNGSYGFYLFGNNNNNQQPDLVLEGNLIENSYYMGAYIQSLEAPMLLNNSVITNSNYSSSHGIYINSCYSDVNVLKNQVFGFTWTGIFLNNSGGTVTNPMLIANNFIQMEGTNWGQALYTDDGAYQKFYYNTVHVTNTNTSSSAFYTYRGNNKEVLNNIFVNTGGGYAFFRSSFSGITQSDHNDLYVTGNFLGNWNGDQADLAAWITASNLDSNSVSLDPLFVDSTDLHVTNVALDKIGTPVPEVTDDIDGELRNPTNPDSGADEFITAQNDAALVSIDSPVMPFAATVQPIQVTILNNGLDTLQSLDIEWEINEVQQATFNWTGLLLSGQILDSLEIGTFTFEVDTMYTIRAWTSLPNGVVDTENFNDTASVTNLYAALSGIYTIGGSNPDFENFSEAVNAMVMGGVAGAVTFSVRDGDYEEQISIPEINGASADHTITFQSESGDSTEVRLRYTNATNADNYVLELDGADWLRFEQMTIQNYGTNYTRCVYYWNEANNNRFEGCVFEGYDIGSNSDIYALVYSNSWNDDYNVFENNYFKEGSFGIYAFGNNSSNLEMGTEIVSNIYEGQYRRSIYLYSQDAPHVQYNEFSTSAASNNYYGVHTGDCENEILITHNYFHDIPAGHGIYCNSNNSTATTRGLIANNFISLGNGTGNDGWGIYLDNNCTYQNVYHNNVIYNSTDANNTFAFYLDNGNNINVKNNVFMILDKGYVYFVPNNPSVDSDYNDLFSATNFVGYWNGTAVNSLAEWQSISGKDANSLSIDPEFISFTDLHVSEVDLNNAGTPVPEVTDDYDGEPRDPNTPDIGADEFAPVTVDDAGVVEIFSPNKNTPFPSGVQQIEVVIKNNGSNALTTVTVQWQVNGLPQAVFNWAGVLQSGERDTVVIGSHNFVPGFGVDLYAATTMPNGMNDTNPSNDASEVLGLYPGLLGTYTIGGTFPDFQNFTTAANALNNGGVLGQVIFNVRNGTYDEQISLNEITGASATNTIIFQSESGNNALVKIRNLNSSSPDYVIQLKGTDYATIQNITLQATGCCISSVFELTNSANNNTLEGCQLIAPVGNTNPVVVSNGSYKNNNNQIINNQIENGGYGIYFRGQGTSMLETGNVIANNFFVDQYYYGVFMEFQDAPSIQKNVIASTTSYSSFSGVYCSYCDNDLMILRNEINSSGGRGIYLYRCDGTVQDRSLIANNFIHVGSNGTAYGIRSFQGSLQNIYFNNVNVTDNDASSRSIYVDGGSNKNLLNNIFSHMGGGYAAYVTSSSNISSSNFNDYYTTGTNLGYWSGTIVTDLAGWQAASGKDLNSLSVNPLFYSNTDLHVLQVALDSAATVIPGIVDDFDGENRNPDQPDIGADEFDFLTDDVGITDMISPIDDCELDDSVSVKVVIQNFGGLPQTGFDVAYVLNGQPPVLENIGSLTIQPGDTSHFSFVTLANLTAYQVHDFEIYTLLGADLNPVNDTLTISVQNYQTPAVVGNMLPADGAVNIDPPINFSWLPAAGAIRYDLYLWQQGDPVPTDPFGEDISQITFAYNNNNLIFGATYNWQLVAKNDFCETPGPIQSFTLRELPDLVVNNVQVPNSPFSGQPIEVSWEVENLGLGSTGMTTWYDYIYLSLDNAYQSGVDTYLGGFANFTALNGMESYAQMKNVTLPQGIQGTYYIIVVTDQGNSIIEGNNNNNVSTAASMLVNLTPPPDLVVLEDSIIVPNNAFSGTNINVIWTIENQGTGDVPIGNNFWDYIYISDDPVYDPANATFLGSFFGGPINANETDKRTKQVTLPNFLFGDYYIHIFTDRFNNVFEHVFEDNNTGSSTVINIILTPPPDLVAYDVAVLDTVSNKQQVAIQWTVENQGANPTTANFHDRIYISNHYPFDPDSVSSLGTVNYSPALGAGISVNRTQTITVPATITGKKYFYVETDVFDNVFEFVNEDNNVSGADSTFVLNTDLIVSSTTVVDTSYSGENINVFWTVKNDGPGNLLTTSRTDLIYISTDPVFDPGAADQIGSLSYSNSLNPGQNLVRQQNVTIPNGIFGNYYIHIQTDANNAVFENTSEDNNLALDSTLVMLSPWPDMQVDIITGLPDSTIAGSFLTLNYVAHNYGTAAVQGISGGWKDQVYISANPTWNPNDAVLLNTIDVLQPLGIDETYNKSWSFNLPMLGNAALTGICYIYVFTDATDKIYEYTDEGNNVKRSNPIYVTAPDPVDFEVLASTLLQDTLNSGQSVNLQWSIKNIGNTTALWNYPLWYDAIYLSADTVFDKYADIFVKDFTKQGPVVSGETYNNSQFFDIPNGLSGDYYAFLVADHTGLTNDGDFDNNIWRIGTTATGGGPGDPVINIELTSSPDLEVNTVVAPTTAVSGQPIEVIFTVTNIGPGTTLQSWSDKVYLSTDFEIDGSDIIIGNQSQNRTLLTGESYTDTLSAFIPITSTGNFVLIFKTDANNAIFELDGENNNEFFTFLTASLPLPSDLIVDSIQFSNMAMVGDPFAVNYTVLNQGVNPASGVMLDIVYFSTDSLFDVSDVPFFGPFQRQINLAPQANLSGTFTNTTPGVPLGEYFIIVQTDALNNIFENSDTNNVTISTEKVMVAVQELPLGVLTPDTLYNNINLYYRIEIPDSLEGETMLVTLDGQTPRGVNELYLSHGSMPTRSVHDYSFSNAFAPDQSIVVPELIKGQYYLLAYGATDFTPANGEQSIDLKAEIIPFEILNVDDVKGGNTGNVTIRLDGAKFTPNMDVRLEDVTLGSYTAHTLTFINSTRVFATFNLAGASLGVYDVVAEKTPEMAVLTDGFEIVTGGAGTTTSGGSGGGGGFFCNIVNVGTDQNLSKNIAHPSAIRINRVAPITIQFGNNGNVDIPCPTRWLVSLRGAPLGFTVDEFPENKQELYLNFQEIGGPLGILRPGAFSSITVYSYSSHPMRFVLRE
ncbi:MAG: CARDB domain-containing protein [Bacteroidota bacterium]